MHSQVLENSHIGSKSYLSSDYLNLYTEIVILLEGAADHPDYMSDIMEWKARSYCDHFRASLLPFSDLAIWAYEHAPRESLEKFDALVDHTNERIVTCQKMIKTTARTGSIDSLRDWLAEQATEIRNTLDQASTLIDRSEHHVDQSDIDRMFMD